MLQKVGIVPNTTKITYPTFVFSKNKIRIKRIYSALKGSSANQKCLMNYLLNFILFKLKNEVRIKNGF